MEQIFLDAVSYKYKYFESEEKKELSAVKNINLKINQGEFISILGVNGSGKSTLAKHFNAIFKPSSGTVIINGLNTLEEENIFEIRKNCGMVFQNPDNQIVGTIVEDDVAFGVENLGVPSEQIKEKVKNALIEVDMYEFLKKPPNFLSGGQKQRVSIAGILAMEPKCIVLDEPTAMLDPSGRKNLLNTAMKLNKEKNITIILITHFMEETINSDKILVMDKGEIILNDTPKEIFKQVNTLKKLGLSVPQVTEIAYYLNKKGLNIKSNILNIDDLVGAICRLK